MPEESSQTAGRVPAARDVNSPRVAPSPRRGSKLPARPWFSLAMGCVSLGAMAFGFGRTYVVPLSRRDFEAPLVVHLHGALAVTWVLLFLAQPLLVWRRRVRWHRQLGVIGLPVAIGILITLIPVGLHQATRDAQAGGGPVAISSFLGVLTSGLIFVALVAAGIHTRKQPEAHARWMLLATLVLVWPAWYRIRHYFPSVPHPEVWFAVVLAYVWIPLAALRDHLVRGSVHPVLTWGGLAVIVEQSLEVITFDSPWWRATADVLYRWFGAS